SLPGQPIHILFASEKTQPSPVTRPPILALYSNMPSFLQTLTGNLLETIIVLPITSSIYSNHYTRKCLKVNLLISDYIFYKLFIYLSAIIDNTSIMPF